MTMRSIKTEADLQAYCQHFNCNQSDITVIKNLIEKGMNFKVEMPESVIEDYILPHINDGKGTLVDTLVEECSYDPHYQEFHNNMFGVNVEIKQPSKTTLESINELERMITMDAGMGGYLDYIVDEAHYNEFADNMKESMDGYAEAIAQIEENKPELTEEQKALILEKYKGVLKKLKGE